MSQVAPSHSSWNISRSSTACNACGMALEPGKGCWAALVEGIAAPNPDAQQPASEKVAIPYSRIEFCEGCWAAGRRPAAPAIMYCFWKTIIPTPQQKKKLLVDDSVLVELFTRLAGRDDPRDVHFRFVLALILMRKRLLKYDGVKESTSTGTAQPEVWKMQPRGGGDPVEVINPQLTTDQITAVSQQLSGILAEEI